MCQLQNVRDIFITVVKQIEKQAGEPIADKGDCVIL